MVYFEAEVSPFLGTATYKKKQLNRDLLEMAQTHH
jgi:hypothetical protein